VRAAVERMELVEHLARVTLVAELAGGAKLLTREQVAALVASRERYGLPPLPDGAISWVVAEDRGEGTAKTSRQAAAEKSGSKLPHSKG